LSSNWFGEAGTTYHPALQIVETSTDRPTELDDYHRLTPQNTDGYYREVSAAFMGRWDPALVFELVQSKWYYLYLALRTTRDIDDSTDSRSHIP
jgi:hypothetical protein